MISLQEFLNLFETSPADNQTLELFIETSIVKVQQRTYKLQDYMERKSISKETIKLILMNIKNRKKYLTGFYNMSLRITEKNKHIHNKIKPMPSDNMNNNKGVIYKNKIRNLHMMDILKNTSSGLDNIPTYLSIIEDLYKQNIIDYKILTPSSISYIKKGRLGSVFSSFYFRASILNPYLIYSLNETVLKGTKIFSPTLGWSSYAFGFLESPMVKEYVGTDVISEVCEKTKDICKEYDVLYNIYNSPSEELIKNQSFIKKYQGHFDVIFFSPPYYRLELYASDNQSTTNYKTYEEWLNKYWKETVKLCSKVIEKKGRMCYILSDYGSQNKKKYNLIDDMNRITQKYFYFKSIQPMYNKNVHSTKHREQGEKIIIFENQ